MGGQCKNGIIIVVHQIQGHRIYSESIGWAIDAQGSPESPGSGSNRDLVSILYRLQYTHPTCTAQARPPEVYQHSLGGKDTVTACCTMISPALSVLFGQTAKKRPEGLKISTSPGQNNCPWSLTQSFWMAGKEKRTFTFPKCQSSSTRWNLR